MNAVQAGRSHGEAAAPSFLAAIAAIFALSRAGFAAVAYFGGWQIPNALCQWDCGWYLTIVEHGYMLEPPLNNPQTNWAFFPLYPLLVRGVQAITGLSPVAAGVLASNAAILAGVYFGCRHLRRTRPQQSVLPFIVLTLAGPYSFYFSTVYTEALFFMLACSTFFFWSGERPIRAGLAGLLLSATRAIGVFMTVAFAVDLLRRYRWSAPLVALRRPELLLACVLAPAGLFAFMAYLHFHVGDALAFAHVQIAWRRVPGNPLHHLLGAFDPRNLTNLLHGEPSNFYDRCWGLMGFGLLGWLTYRGRLMEAAFGFFCLLVPLSTGLASIPRFVVGSPVFAFALTDILSNLRHGWVGPALLGLGVVFNLILLAAWFNGAGFLI